MNNGPVFEQWHRDQEMNIALKVQMLIDAVICLDYPV